MSTRIGPAMYAAAAYVAEHPGCPGKWVAAHVGPNGSLQYGYRTVHRALTAGLIEDRAADDDVRYELHVTDVGWKALKEQAQDAP